MRQIVAGFTSGIPVLKVLKIANFTEIIIGAIFEIRNFTRIFGKNLGKLTEIQKGILDEFLRKF